MSTASETHLRIALYQEKMLNYFRDQLDLRVFSPIYRNIALEVSCETAKAEIRMMANAARNELNIPLVPDPSNLILEEFV
jgi:hypothetical protein